MLTADVGSHPTLKLSASLNETAGPSAEADLCDGWVPLEVRQKGDLFLSAERRRVMLRCLGPSGYQYCG
jgi:hypothetical protein